PGTMAEQCNRLCRPAVEAKWSEIRTDGEGIAGQRCVVKIRTVHQVAGSGDDDVPVFVAAAIGLAQVEGSRCVVYARSSRGVGIVREQRTLQADIYRVKLGSSVDQRQSRRSLAKAFA